MLILMTNDYKYADADAPAMPILRPPAKKWENHPETHCTYIMFSFP